MTPKALSQPYSGALRRCEAEARGLALDLDALREIDAERAVRVAEQLRRAER